VAFVAWFVVSAGGCAAITGLDSISEQDCAPNCSDAQATKDVTVDVPSGDSTAAEASSGMDTGSVEATLDGPGTQDTSKPSEASTKDAGMDAPVEAPADAPEGSSPDAPFDSGCGDLNTTTNCSACGDKCASTMTIETTSTCGGDTNGFAATCSYTCASGHQDCNAANAPNLDGCECMVAGATQAQCCLGTASCPITHNNGLNQASSRFFDCDTYAANPSQVADDACIAYVGAANAGQCGPYSDSDASTVDSWCSGAFTGDCICWTFAGQYAGQVYDAKAQGAPMPSSCYYGQSATLFN
jgi:hypothetical protein